MFVTSLLAALQISCSPSTLRNTRCRQFCTVKLQSRQVCGTKHQQRKPPSGQGAHFAPASAAPSGSATACRLCTPHSSRRCNVYCFAGSPFALNHCWHVPLTLASRPARCCLTLCFNPAAVPCKPKTLNPAWLCSAWPRGRLCTGGPSGMPLR